MLFFHSVRLPICGILFRVAGVVLSACKAKPVSGCNCLASVTSTSAYLLLLLSWCWGGGGDDVRFGEMVGLQLPGKEPRNAAG